VPGPGGDPDADPQQADRDEGVDEPAADGQAGVGVAVGDQEHPYGGDEGERLRDLNPERAGDGPPRQAGDAVGLLESVEGQEQRSAGGQQDDDRRTADAGQ
jgi:hypothetical protein